LNQRILSASECAAIFNSISGTTIYFDIETHPATDTVQCFSFNTPDSPTYTYLVYDYRGNVNGNAAAVFAAWARAQRRNTVVIHNACFDLPFLAHYHGVPFGADVEDTMLMWHRAFPEAEKSLGHVISALLNEPFHKGTATFNPHNYAQQQALLTYNAKDVHTLRAIHRELHALAASNDGLRSSFAQVNSSIAPYLFAGLRGFELNTNKQRAHVAALRARVDQLTRVFRTLTGMADVNPNSAPQLAEWLIDGLGYKVLATTDGGAPSMDAKTIYQYLLLYPNNVALKVLLAIKKQAKQLQMLGFEPFTNLDKR
jgi:DNA polymerase I-like protein with 3'-5' exonuclease and polymerase domains